MSHRCESFLSTLLCPTRPPQLHLPPSCPLSRSPPIVFLASSSRIYPPPSLVSSWKFFFFSSCLTLTIDDVTIPSPFKFPNCHPEKFFCKDLRIWWSEAMTPLRGTIGRSLLQCMKILNSFFIFSGHTEMHRRQGISLVAMLLFYLPSEWPEMGTLQQVDCFPIRAILRHCMWQMFLLRCIIDFDLIRNQRQGSEFFLGN